MNSEQLSIHLSFLNDRFKGRTILISGSTGLIGSHVVQLIDILNKLKDTGIQSVLLYRDEQKREKLASCLSRPDLVQFVKCDVERDIPYSENVDYIVHCAGFSGGTKIHLKDPVKVFDTGINGTRNLLDFAVTHNLKGFLYVSTYEVYGDISNEEKIKENQACQLDTFVLRNCYAEIKRLCESLLCAFSEKYGFKTYAVRLTSTFGSGVIYNDPRFFAEFARCAIEGRDIILKSYGKTVRSYLDADDAAIAFLYVLTNGESCNAYNLTNMDNVISIKDIAVRIIELTDAKINIVFDASEDAHKLGLRQEGKTVMDATKLEAIGWKAVYTLNETLLKLIKSMKESR